MAETFTSDNTTETEVLTEEEQDSLAVGEKMIAEQEGLLAGKYKNAEDLEAAYISLQEKLGRKIRCRVTTKRREQRNHPRRSKRRGKTY